MENIIINNKNGKRFHLTLMLMNLLIVAYGLSKGSVSAYSYIVFAYCLLVVFFFFRSFELKDDQLIIYYNLRPFFRVKKRDLSRIKKVFYSTENGVLVYPNMKFWFNRVVFIEFRLEGGSSEVSRILAFLEGKANYKLTFNENGS